MDKTKLEELHKEAVEKFEEYMNAKKEVKEEDHQKIHAAKSEWQNAWNKLMETLLVLERLEI